jgi:hypothetical protein
MRPVIFVTISLIIALSFTSCEKKYFKPLPVDPNVPVSFKGEIEPLFEAKCALSGCHNGAVSPNLSKDKCYASLMEGGYVDTLKPDESLLMIKLNTNMPPQKLPPSDINKVLSWIKQGAKEN